MPTVDQDLARHAAVARKMADALGDFAVNLLIAVLILAGLIAAAAGMLFGIPSLRIKGLYLAVATLAAQFFTDWLFARVKWFTDYAHSGSVSPAPVELFGWRIDTPVEIEYYRNGGILQTVLRNMLARAKAQ